MLEPLTHPKTARLNWNGKDCLIRDLEAVGWDAPRHAAKLALQSHRHPGVYEVCYIVEGGVQWWVRTPDKQMEVFQVEAGQVFIARPGEEHGGVDSALHPCELYWLQFRAPKKPALASLVKRWTRRIFPGSSRVRDAMARIVLEHTLRDAWSPAAAEAQLHELIALLSRDHAGASQSPARQSVSPQVRTAMQWMIEHLPENFGIADVADSVGLSLAAFHQRFHHDLGYTPSDWRTRQRLMLAQRRLIEHPDESILDTALACGFSSSQYFATTCKKVLGLSPRQLRSKRFT